MNRHEGERVSLPIEELTVRVLTAPLREKVPMSFSALTARRCVLFTLRSVVRPRRGRGAAPPPEGVSPDRPEAL